MLVSKLRDEDIGVHGNTNIWKVMMCIVSNVAVHVLQQVYGKMP